MKTASRLGLLFFCAAFLLFFQPLKAQYHLSGADPARARWNRLKVGPTELIYPRGLDSLAFRYAFLIEKAAGEVTAPYGVKMPTLPVVLHPYTVESNGMVVWAPRRMELYTTPEALGESQNWEKQLVVHEFRHVAQMAAAGEGFFKYLGYLAGEQSEGVSVALLFSKWMLEGDAVVAETNYSSAGRGRDASFLMPYKAYLENGINFKAKKWLMGSYKHYIPNHYANGYFVLSAAEALKGRNGLPPVFKESTRHFLWPFHIVDTMRVYLGGRTRDLWPQAVDYYMPLWKELDAAKAPITPFDTISTPSKDYVTYRSPICLRSGDSAHSVGATAQVGVTHSVGATAQVGVTHSVGATAQVGTSSVGPANPAGATGRFFAFKTTLSRAMRLVELLPGQKERALFTVGNVNSDLTAGGPFLAWTEEVSGERWEHEDFSVIRLYNPSAGGDPITLRRRTRYFSPALSPNGEQVAVAHYKVNGGSELHILNTAGGAIERIYPVPQGRQLSELQWGPQGLLYALMISDEGKGLYAFHQDTQEWEELMVPHFTGMDHLRYQEGQLLFDTDYQTCANIYTYAPQTRTLTQLTEARYGAFDPLLVNDTLYYANYAVNGYHIVATPRSQWLGEVIPEATFAATATELAKPGYFNIDTLQVPQNLSYPVKPYRKGTHLFKFHSWMPFYFDFDELANFSFETFYQTAALGATLNSQNTLGTAVTRLGYRYYKGFHSGHLNFTYSGWYPVLSFKGNVNTRHRLLTYVEKRDSSYAVVTDTLRKPYVELQAQAYIPFTFHSGGWLRGLTPSVSWTYTNDGYYLATKNGFVDKQILQLGLRYYQTARMAHRDIYPRWGLGLSMQYAFAPGGGQLFTDLSYVQAYGYLPGVAPNHGLRLEAAYQRQNTSGRGYYLGALLAPPYGLTQDLTLAPHAVTVKAQYAMPFWLGDFKLSEALYFKRLQVLPFAHYLRTMDNASRFTSHYASYGADVLVDFHPFLFMVELSVGVRYAYTSLGHHHVQFLFSTSLF